MKDKIEKILTESFSEHRLIFWYDEKAEMKDLFNSLQLEGVEKIEIQNNEFGIKYHVLSQEPKTKFLIYQPSPKPDDEENWMLDLILSHKEFRTEPASLYLQELGLANDFNDVIAEHIEFFNNQNRIKKLKEFLSESESKDSLRLKMIAAICNTEVDFEKILFTLFSEILDSNEDSNELFKNKQEKYSSVAKFRLDKFFWDRVKLLYRYANSNPTIKDFVIELMSHNLFCNFKYDQANLFNEAIILVNHWKENAKFLSFYKSLSKQISGVINLKMLMQDVKIEDILTNDTFDLVDTIIISEIKNQLRNGNFNNKMLQEWISERSNKFFYSEFENIYKALSLAANLLVIIPKTDYSIESISQGIENYVKQYYLIDKYYRQYITYSEKLSGEIILQDISELIEKLYSNFYLLKLCDNWQKSVDTIVNWKFPEFAMQTDFYERNIKQFENSRNKIFVIISDALRFEIGHELSDMITKENRYEAELDFQISTLPSYTQLGMAALLPHKKLSFDNDDDYVSVDGLSSSGKDNRTKILQKYNEESISIGAEEFLKMRSNPVGREFVKPYSIIYIYSNTIDKTGDSRDSEHRAFNSVEEEIQIIFRLIKQIANVNGTNIIITADHGFIYQHNILDETDFIELQTNGGEFKKNRRFVIGTNLEANMSVKKFTSDQLGIGGGKDFLIPKSINRIRVQGAGSRFVHGGASLQEIIIPIVRVNKKRQSDISKVEVDLISASSRITSNRVGLSFFQRQLVGEKVLKRSLKIAFYSNQNELISDVFQKDFDNSNKNDITKEISHVFNLTSETSKLSNKEIKLKFEELIEGTSSYCLYKEHSFNLAVSIYNDFED